MFSKFSRVVSKLTGHPITFTLSLVFIFVWLLTAPLFKSYDSWQIVINTITTIITFLMVFIIQNSQNRETLALQIKLDEIIRSLQSAHNRILNIEAWADKDLEDLQKKYEEIAKKIQNKKSDLGSPEI